MRPIALLLFPLLALAWWNTASAQANDAPKPDPVILTDEQEKYPLGLHLEILEDPSGELTIEDVSALEFDSQFVTSQDDSPNFGFSEDAHWVRFRLRNESSLNDRWLLDVRFANIHFVDLYTPSPDGEGFDVKKTGALRSPETRDIPHPHFVFDLTIPAQSQQSVYLRVESGASTPFPAILWTPDAFWIESQWEQVAYGVFFGILIALLLYNLFLLFSLREPSYLYLVLLLGSWLAFDVAYSGYLETYVVPNLYLQRLNYMSLSFPLIFISMVLFTDTFLELKARVPKLHRVNIAILVVWGVLILLIPLTSYFQSAILMVPWALTSLLVVLIAGVVSWRGGFRPARFFMIAWFGLVVTFFILLLQRLGVGTGTIFSEIAFRLGLVWMAAFWSIALADRVNLLKAETEGANRDLRNSEHRLSQILEGMPLGVIVYGKDQKPNYINQRMIDILKNPAQGLVPDISAGRTLGEGLKFFSLKVTGSDQEYPLESFPVYRALKGEPASADDIEADLVDKRVPLEIWASPVKDDVGNVEWAVAAIQDITQRKLAETELAEYRKNLELLVGERTAELNASNTQLNLEMAERKMLEQVLNQRIEWLSALNQIRQTISGTADLPQAYEQLMITVLQLLDARAVFLLRWDGQGEQIETFSHLERDESIHNLEGIAAIIKNDSPLRKEIELGKLIKLSADQAVSLPAPLGEDFQKDGFQSLLLAPLILRQSVAGVVGTALPQPTQEFTSAQADLIGTIMLDLADLIEDAHLLDQARALVAAEERGRLARDLHDSVTQVLFSGSLVAEVLPRIWRRDPEQAMKSLEELRRLTRGALAEMRTMLLELRPHSVLKTPLSELLAQLTEAITSRTALPFQLSIEKIPSLPDEVHISFYRIAQEALNNVVKHAQASQVSVSLSATPLAPDPAGVMRFEVKLVISDNGEGFSTESRWSEHMGLGIMNERATAVDADLVVDSQPGMGTTVTLICCTEVENES